MENLKIKTSFATAVNAVYLNMIYSINMVENLAIGNHMIFIAIKVQ